MGVSVDASQLRNLGIEISYDADQVGEKVAVGMRKIGYSIEGTAKILVPVDTGNLLSSIGTKVSGGASAGFIEVEVSATTNYADYVEYGTSEMAPQPYMGPAFDQHAGDVGDVILSATLDL